jgi:hypothetical protein
MAGRDDFLFPPEHQAQLAAGIRNAQLVIVERAGHNPQSEQPDVVMEEVTRLLAVPGEVARPTTRQRTRRARSLRRAEVPA